DLAGPGDRREHPLRLDWLPSLGGLAGALEPALAVEHQVDEIRVAHGDDAAVSPDTDRGLAAVHVRDEPHAAASITQRSPVMTSVSPTSGAIAWREPVVSYFGTSSRKRSTSGSRSR